MLAFAFAFAFAIRFAEVSQGAALEALARRFRRERNLGQERTYPPPADGPCINFLCNSRRDERGLRGQQGRGPEAKAGYFTL